MHFSEDKQSRRMNRFFGINVKAMRNLDSFSLYHILKKENMHGAESVAKFCGQTLTFC